MAIEIDLGIGVVAACVQEQVAHTHTTRTTNDGVLV